MSAPFSSSNRIRSLSRMEYVFLNRTRILSDGIKWIISVTSRYNGSDRFLIKDEWFKWEIMNIKGYMFGWLNIFESHEWGVVKGVHTRIPCTVLFGTRWKVVALEFILITLASININKLPPLFLTVNWIIYIIQVRICIGCLYVVGSVLAFTWTITIVLCCGNEFGVISIIYLTVVLPITFVCKIIYSTINLTDICVFYLSLIQILSQLCISVISMSKETIASIIHIISVADLTIMHIFSLPVTVSIDCRHCIDTLLVLIQGEVIFVHFRQKFFENGLRSGNVLCRIRTIVGHTIFFTHFRCFGRLRRKVVLLMIQIVVVWILSIR